MANATGRMKRPTYVDADALEKLREELAAMKNTRVFTLASNDAKLLFVLHQRLVETLLYGEAKTALPASHHE